MSSSVNASRDADTASTKGPLSLLVIGTGRDGTLSVSQMIGAIYEAEGKGRTVAHEYRARDFYNAFCNLRETGDDKYSAEIRNLIRDCPYDCIVGNGYAAVLPDFVALHGRGLKVVHLYRSDRNACIESFVENSKLFPETFAYYGADIPQAMKRMAAFHFGEMTCDAWKRLSVYEKFSWYYDKTHELVRACRSLTDHYVELAMEDLDSERARRTLARVAADDDNLLPQPAHLNAHRIDIMALPPDRQAKIQWLMGRLDLRRLAQDDAYAAAYFLNQFVAWTGYQIRGEIADISPTDIRSDRELIQTVDQMSSAIEAARAAIDIYKAILNKRRKS